MIIFKANPHYYDYFHFLCLKPNKKKIKLVDGGGQKINFVAKGKYELIENLTDGILKITELQNGYF